MSVVWRCDFCGKDMDKDEMKIASSYTYNSVYLDSEERFSWDICPECHERISLLRRNVLRTSHAICAEDLEKGER